MSEFEQVRMDDGSAGFRKYLTSGRSDCFLAEARGLAAMAATGTVDTPEVLRVDDSQLITRFLQPGRPRREDWIQLGDNLARMHQREQAGFGFSEDNYCGASPQPNPHYEDGHRFFAEQRLLYQGQRALDRGLLRSADMATLESICCRLGELVPEQDPALLHGDLWSGNVLFTAEGPFLIDPACYFGWPEADLAMTELFGRFDPAFYSAYRERRRLHSGYEERVPLYNLYHLLNHLNIFGTSYQGEVIAVLGRFA